MTRLILLNTVLIVLVMGFCSCQKEEPIPAPPAPETSMPETKPEEPAVREDPMTDQSPNDIFKASSFLQGHNAEYIEQLYARYANDPNAVDARVAITRA